MKESLLVCAWFSAKVQDPETLELLKVPTFTIVPRRVYLNTLSPYTKYRVVKYPSSSGPVEALNEPLHPVPTDGAREKAIVLPGIGDRAVSVLPWLAAEKQLISFTSEEYELIPLCILWSNFNVILFMCYSIVIGSSDPSESSESSLFVTHVPSGNLNRERTKNVACLSF